MPDPVRNPVKRKPGKGGARIFGFPWYVVVGGAVAAIVIGLYLRHSSGASGTSAAPAQDTTGGGGTGSAAPSPADAAPANVDLTGLQDAINNLGSIFGGFAPVAAGGALDSSGFQYPAGYGYSIGAGGYPVGQVSPDTLYPGGFTAAQVAGAQGATPDAYGNFTIRQVDSPVTQAPSRTPVAHPTATLPNIHVVSSLPISAAPAGVKQTNVQSVQRLKSGATLTTLKSGKVIEQAPGKTPYIVHK